VLLDIVEYRDAPTHLLLGRDAVKLIKERLAVLEEQIKGWEPVSYSTDYTLIKERGLMIHSAPF
jgi:hypothetical protein